MQDKPDAMVSMIEATVYNADKSHYEFVVIEEQTQHVVFEDYYETTSNRIGRFS